MQIIRSQSNLFANFSNNPCMYNWSAKQQLPILKLYKKLSILVLPYMQYYAKKYPFGGHTPVIITIFNNRIFPIENPVKNGHDHLALLIIFSLTITVL